MLVLYFARLPSIQSEVYNPAQRSTARLNAFCLIPHQLQLLRHGE